MVIYVAYPLFWLIDKGRLLWDLTCCLKILCALSACFVFSHNLLLYTSYPVLIFIMEVDALCLCISIRKYGLSCIPCNVDTLDEMDGC